MTPRPIAAQQTPHPNAGDVVGGKYRVGCLLGAGGMGMVFSAEHLVTGKPVAIKWMLPELVEQEGAVDRFVREARAASRVCHPNVVEIFDVGRDRDALYLVMERLSGRPLDAVLATGGGDLLQLTDWVADAIRGLAAAHRVGVIHRDIKPENIFICDAPDGHSRATGKVLDFGVSMLTEGSEGASTRLTQTGMVVGTPHYMSPEQVTGQADVDARTDVYGMGVLLYEVFTGHVPFDASTFPELVVQIVHGPTPTPDAVAPGLAPALVSLINRAMARDRNRRLQGADALFEGLSEVRKSMQAGSHREVPVPRHSMMCATTLAAERLEPSGRRALAQTAGAEARSERAPTSSDRSAGRAAPEAHARTRVGARGSWLLVATAVVACFGAVWLWLNARGVEEVDDAFRAPTATGREFPIPELVPVRTPPVRASKASAAAPQLKPAEATAPAGLGQSRERTVPSPATSRQLRSSPRQQGTRARPLEARGKSGRVRVDEF